MNTTPSEAGLLATQIRTRLTDHGGATVVLCPPSIALSTVSRSLDGSHIAVGAQNIHPETSGAFTGEISSEMASAFADYVIVGHSERRALFGESDEFVSRKVASALDAGLRPILCVGESVDVRDQGRAEPFVRDQLINGLARVDSLSRILIAYEPVWAIGTGQAATPEVAQEMLGMIRSTLADRFGDAAIDVPCLYGGSVTVANVSEFVGQRDIDGSLVGSASLTAESFSDIVREATQTQAHKTMPEGRTI